MISLVASSEWQTQLAVPTTKDTFHLAPDLRDAPGLKGPGL
ncbi:MAG TPA: hypothetical protein VFS76_26270 [Pyrinomonadaceae bacterium]|nr:hypothetical protein [Pyrinomonadaceae bacterium]